MSYCDNHIILNGCIPGDEVMIRRDDECTECVREERDRMRGIIYSALCAAPVGYLPNHDADHLPQIVADLAETAGKAGALEDEVDGLRDERDRLREIIRKEGEKWAEHHTDIEKKKYWAAFALKAGRPK